MVTKWFGRYGLQFGAIDGIQHTSIKVEDEKIERKRRSVVLVGKVESDYPFNSVLFVFFCFRFVIKKY